MNKKEFKKLSYCLELLAITEIILDKKKLLNNKLLNRLKNKLFNSYSEEELNNNSYSEEELNNNSYSEEELYKFIKFEELIEEQVEKKVKKLTGLNYDEAIKFAKENKENYIQIYNLNYANNHDGILYIIRGKFEEYLDIVEKVYKKEAKEIFKSLVTKSKFWEI